MNAIPRAVLNKIPGGGMPVAQREKHVKDLNKLTHAELLEIKEREGKLLANKAKLSRLPDKGQRIQCFHDKVQHELERRCNVDEAAALFSEMNIVAKGVTMLNKLEWNGDLNDLHAADAADDVLDSDDETEMDPLRIIAQRSMHERKTKVLPPEQTLITADDLAEIQTFSADSPDSGLASSETAAATDVETIDAEFIAINVSDKLSHIKPKLQQLHVPGQVQKHPDAATSSTTSAADSPANSRTDSPIAAQEVEQHVRYLVDMVEHPAREPQRDKFKPYQTTISNVHDPAKEKLRKQGKKWEITAATPPPMQHSATKMLTLLDSVEIQCSYLAKLKQLQEQQAAARLAAKLSRLQSRKLELPSVEALTRSAAFTDYRSTAVTHIEGDHRRFNEIDEVHDPLDEEKPGAGVTYTVYE